MKKKHEIVMLQSEKASNLVSQDGYSNLIYFKDKIKANHNDTNQHLYILSDEEIKEGDWTIQKNIINPIKIDDSFSKDFLKECCKKIIATTNSDLWKITVKEDEDWDDNVGAIDHSEYKAGIPSLPHDFIEAYVKAYNEGNPITHVMLEYKDADYDYINTALQGKPMVKPILKLRSNKTVICSPVEEKVYTREDMFEAFKEGIEQEANNKEFSTFNDWLNNYNLTKK